MHIPDDPLYYEKFYFTPGDTGFRAWETRHAQDRRADLLGPVVPRRRAPHRPAGRQILFYPTAIGWHPRRRREYGKAQHEAWELIQRSHAVANGCYVCAPNRIGLERILDATASR